MSIETSLTINSERFSPNSITFSAGKEVMRITSRGITVAPDVHVEEAAKVVIEALEKHLLNLVAAARADALEEAARVVARHYETLCAEHRLLLVNRAAAIRALKEKPHD